MKMRRYVYEGELIPKLYGVAWYDVLYLRAVCYPLPINVLIALAHRLWWKMKKPAVRHCELHRRYLEGWHDGFDEAMKRNA